MDNSVKRWFILLAGIFANVCQGAAYASSIFAVPLMLHLNQVVPGKLTPDGLPVPDMSKWAPAFSLNLAMLPIGMLLSGKLVDKGSPRLVVFLGAIVFGLGMFLAGYTQSLTWLYLTFGVMMGLGSGAAYGSVVATSVRWFPDRRGLASGLAVGALGFGPVLIVPIGEYLLKTTASNPADAVLPTMKIFGIAFFIIMALASTLMVSPPADYAVKGAAAAKAAPAGKDYNWTQMLGTGKFWTLFLLYACGAFSGLMVISQAKYIVLGSKLMSDPKALAAFASSVVMLIAVSNAFGRVVWATVSDWIGRNLSLALMFLITAVVMFKLPVFLASEKTLIPAAVLIGACFGGYLGTFPALCAEAFGGKCLTINYALLFSGFSVAAIAGPIVAGNINKETGSYAQAFILAGMVATVGLVVAIIFTATQSKKKKAAA